VFAYLHYTINEQATKNIAVRFGEFALDRLCADFGAIDSQSDTLFKMTTSRQMRHEVQPHIQQEIHVSPHRLSSAILVVALVASSTLVVVLALQKRSLSERQRDLMVRMRDPYPGLYVPVIYTMTVAGDSVRLGDPGTGRYQLSFVFGTTCDFSEASLPAWKDIALKLAGNAHVDIVGVSVDGVEETRAFVAEHDIPFPVVSFTDGRLRALYRTYVVPQTVIVIGDGKVTYAKVGAVTDGAVTDSIIASVNSAAEESMLGAVSHTFDSLP